MKTLINLTLCVFLMIGNSVLKAEKKIKVVTTLTTYASITEYIGDERVEVKAIVPGNQDAHFVRPRPSYAVWLNEADLFIETGLDLELWVPPLVDKSANPNIRSGQKGYVSVADGVQKLEVPTVADRSQGDVHIFGNPHIFTSPLNAKIIAENITIGLIKVRPDFGEEFRDGLLRFQNEIDKRLFGEELVNILGGDALQELAESQNLIDFLEEKSFKEKKLIDYLGGWMLEMLPLRDRSLVAYHKNWAYFENLFGLNVIGYVEPKPGIPPSPKHVELLVKEMREKKVNVIIAANYFDESKVHNIAEKVNAIAVIVPLGINGIPGIDNYFKLVDYWIKNLIKAYQIHG
jgi:ABC-type Zn uptake system ZnuABC Zn-binding protein ZnuA